MADNRSIVVGDTTVGANYQKTYAPFTRFGTRQIAFFLFDLYDLANDTLIDEEIAGEDPFTHPEYEQEYDADGYFAKAIRGIQQNAELFMVFRPDYSSRNWVSNTGNNFIVGVAIETAIQNEMDFFTDNSKSLADVVYDAIDGDSGVDVYHMRVRGDEFRYTALNGLVADEGNPPAKVRVSRPD